MRIGYPCINRGMGCSSSRTFRLASYTSGRLISTVGENLSCLRRILEWNCRNGILFFRIGSGIVPFASHPAGSFPWKRHFRDELAAIGDLVRESGTRISMHPDQFIVLNSPDLDVVGRSIAELSYHADLLGLMGLDAGAKIQIHVGGLYRDRSGSIARFVSVWERLDPGIRQHLVIENDDSRFGAADCLGIHEKTGIPVLFDIFHHRCHNRGEEPGAMFARTGETWRRNDGIPMVDYSTQNPGKRTGSHADRIDTGDFQGFLEMSRPCDIDIMLEIKDKERSALAAVRLSRGDPRFVGSVSRRRND